jgi:hypothetical protein
MEGEATTQIKCNNGNVQPAPSQSLVTRLSWELQRLASHNRPPQTVLEWEIERFASWNRWPQTVSTPPVPPTTAQQLPVLASRPLTRGFKRELQRFTNHSTVSQTVLQQTDQRAIERFPTHDRPPETAQLPPMWTITYHKSRNHTKKR